jgi:hypothetical protein
MDPDAPFSIFYEKRAILLATCAKEKTRRGRTGCLKNVGMEVRPGLAEDN